MLSTRGYRPKLNTVYLCFTSSHGRSLCHEGKPVCSRFPPYKAAAPTAPFFPSKAVKCLFKNVTSWCISGTGFCFTFFSAKGDKTPSKRHILMSAVTFSTNGLWMQDFTKNWACDHFVGNTAPSKMQPKLTISLQTKVVCYSPLF